eukprot:CAMPEP_0118879606 /NCGR_PEP_ID=MMETSP1163-20130328/19371_1 /TAXON_ID=124430 /ORGANISM="Phaeomonas parva, Strain CCMP2877" /LENGTH=186 /DNA_ID=CAMNT_0006815803 /DNA_START=132 /DNA_END=692 /DNA_ORIENTATION=-
MKLLLLVAAVEAALAFRAPLASRRMGLLSLRSTPGPAEEPVAQAAAVDGPTPMAPPAEDAVEEGDEKLTPEQKKAKALRDAEKFMVKETGLMECSVCTYIYKSDEGDGRRLPPGTEWDNIADNWRCPDCGAPKEAFQASMVTIAGFEVNQGYGFGGNSLTGDQKSGLVFGGLILFFLVFMSGYLME